MLYDRCDQFDSILLFFDSSFLKLNIDEFYGMGFGPKFGIGYLDKNLESSDYRW